jgi:hypothetical protein
LQVDRANTMTSYYGVVGNRDYIKLEGQRLPFWHFLDRHPAGWLCSLAYRRGGEMPGRLCDLAQQGRYAEKRGWRSEHQVGEPADHAVEVFPLPINGEQNERPVTR